MVTWGVWFPGDRPHSAPIITSPCRLPNPSCHGPHPGAHGHSATVAGRAAKNLPVTSGLISPRRASPRSRRPFNRPTDLPARFGEHNPFARGCTHVQHVRKCLKINVFDTYPHSAARGLWTTRSCDQTDQHENDHRDPGSMIADNPHATDPRLRRHPSATSRLPIAGWPETSGHRQRHPTAVHRSPSIRRPGRSRASHSPATARRAVRARSVSRPVRVAAPRPRRLQPEPSRDASRPARRLCRLARHGRRSRPSAIRRRTQPARRVIFPVAGRRDWSHRGGLGTIVRRSAAPRPLAPAAR